jgi:hypothetical protein
MMHEQQLDRIRYGESFPTERDIKRRMRMTDRKIAEDIAGGELHAWRALGPLRAWLDGLAPCWLEEFDEMVEAGDTPAHAGREIARLYLIADRRRTA